MQRLIHTGASVSCDRHTHIHPSITTGPDESENEVAAAAAAWYLLDVGHVQRGVDQPFVHGVFGVFALLVQVHCL